MRRWIPVFMIAASFVFAGVALDRLPEDVTPRLDAIIPWIGSAEPETLPRAVFAFGAPAVALIVWLLLAGLASPAAERLGRRVFPPWFVSPQTGASAVGRFRPTFHIVVAAVVAGIVLSHALMLGLALGWPAWTAQVFTAVLGFGMAVVGSSLPRTRPNWIVGIRTRRTLSDPDLWRHTHRWFGGLLMVAGLIVVGVSLLSAPLALIAAGVGALGSAIAATVIAGRRRKPGASSLSAVP